MTVCAEMRCLKITPCFSLTSNAAPGTGQGGDCTEQDRSRRIVHPSSQMLILPLRCASSFPILHFKFPPLA